jgi:cytochrome c oxidase subunit 2
VLHDFYLPHFRVKMDAVPGMPTYFVFTPSKTTEEYRQELRKYPEYNVEDPNNEGKMLWETFEYELACAELCGAGHWNMRRIVRIVSQQEYDAWVANQSSFYVANIRNKDDDPLKGQKLRIDPVEEAAAVATDSTAVDTTATAPAEQPQ